MVSIFVTSREGERRRIDVDTGGKPSLMEVIRNDTNFELAALCGGMLSCSTCHVYIDSNWADKVDPVEEEEAELLEFSEHLAEHSRLSCQIFLNESHDQMSVTIAPEE